MAAGPPKAIRAHPPELSRYGAESMPHWGPCSCCLVRSNLEVQHALAVHHPLQVLLGESQEPEVLVPRWCFTRPAASSTAEDGDRAGARNRLW